MAETIKKNQFSGSVGAGMKSLFSPGGRTYYVLEHKLSTSQHKAGEKQEIIIDYIELGRDAKCQVRFDEAQGSVSRHHAAILKEGENWKLRHLSKTNETLLNGRPVKSEWYLQSGDEIQLSVGGPKLGFIVPSNNTVGSIGLTRRMSLFRQQALRPYKRAITALSICLFLGITGMGGAMWYMDTQHTEEMIALNGTLSEQTLTIEEQNRLIEDGSRAQDEIKKNFEKLQESIPLIEEEAARKAKEAAIAEIQQRVTQSGDYRVPSSVLAENKPNVFFIKCTKITVTDNNGESRSLTPQNGADRILSGTGFLLNNSKFVTARHVVEPWAFINEQDVQNSSPMVVINAYATAGASVEGFFTAHSSNGQTINFKTSNCNRDNSSDQRRSINTDEGSIPITIASLSHLDWATTTVSMSGGLSFDTQLSTSLTAQTKLEVLGFPLGIGYNSPSDLEPIYGNCIVARDGLENGLILVTDRNFEQGNSGGPVFAFKDNKYHVVGLVSAGAGGSTGFIVPISVIR